MNVFRRKITVPEFVSFIRTTIGTPVLYGTNGERLTQARINTLASAYPTVYDAAYINRARSYIGKRCSDGKGLISWGTKAKQRTLSMYRHTALETIDVKDITEKNIGWAVHDSIDQMGIYIGHGMVVSGMNGETIKEHPIDDVILTKAIKLFDLDYGVKTSAKASMDGWYKSTHWQFYRKGVLLRSQFLEYTDAEGNTNTYYFDKNGNLKTGWMTVSDKKNEDIDRLVYFDETDNDDLIGRMLKNRLIVYAGTLYIIDPDGYLADADERLIVKNVSNPLWD